MSPAPISPSTQNPPLGATLRAIGVAAAIVAVFYLAREILLPFAMAVLLSFLLAPLVRALEKLRFGRILSVVITVAVAFLITCGLAALVTRQALDLAEALPKYEENLIARVRAIRGNGPGMFSDVTKTVDKIEEELENAEVTKRAEKAKNTTLLTSLLSPDGVLPVRVVEDDPKALSLLQSYLGPLITPVGNATIIILFAIFMLLGRGDLRDRVIRLAGTGRVYMTTQALDDAGRRVSRFLLMQCLINATYGVIVVTGLWLFGIPNALLWGLMAAVVRFVPFLGNLVGALAPTLLSLAVFEGWIQPIGIFTMFAVVELVMGNFIEPYLYGETIGVSMIGIIAAAVFWTWLWGPMGLILALPLTVCVTVLARHVPQLSFINVLLADEPPLQLRYRFYQRLLAHDYGEAKTVVLDFLKDGSLEELYDEILVPAIYLAERDRRSGRLGDDEEQFVYDSVAEIVDELGQSYDMTAASNTATEGAAAEEASARRVDVGRSVPVVCLAANGHADHIAGVIFAQLAGARGHTVLACQGYDDPEAALEWLKAEAPGCVVISSVTPNAFASCRKAVALVHEQLPDTHIIAGMWNAKLEERLVTRLRKAGADATVLTISDGLSALEESPSGSLAEEGEEPGDASLEPAYTPG